MQFHIVGLSHYKITKNNETASISLFFLQKKNEGRALRQKSREHNPVVFTVKSPHYQLPASR